MPVYFYTLVEQGPPSPPWTDGHHSRWPPAGCRIIRGQWLTHLNTKDADSFENFDFFDKIHDRIQLCLMRHQSDWLIDPSQRFYRIWRHFNLQAFLSPDERVCCARHQSSLLVSRVNFILQLLNNLTFIKPGLYSLTWAVPF